MGTDRDEIARGPCPCGKGTIRVDALGASIRRIPAHQDHVVKPRYANIGPGIASSTTMEIAVLISSRLGSPV